MESASDSAGLAMARIGEAATHFLESTLLSDEIMGVSSWSETILKMVDNIHPMRSGAQSSSSRLWAVWATRRFRATRPS
ncbi:hypothetical protein [Tropicimonas sp. IMCC6043]|uniref:hypothetical protein n=1 Tax=Tropicimonas sp. IMCC6043 TaxID=2510645 RepID=UPI00268AF888